MNMKRIAIIVCMFLLCNVSYAQNNKNQRSIQAAYALYQIELGKLNKEIEQQNYILKEDKETLFTLRRDLEEERKKYDREILKAYDTEKILKIDEYLNNSFPQMDGWYLTYMMEIAKKYPKDTLFNRRTERIESAIKMKGVYDKADYLNNRLLSLKYKKADFLSTPFKYQEIANQVTQLNNIFNNSNDPRILEMGKQLFSYKKGLDHLSELIESIQKIRKSNPKAKWEDGYKQLFDQLEEEKKQLVEDRKNDPSNSTKSKLERIESLSYLKQCFDQLKTDIKKHSMEESPVEALILRIMG